MKMADSGAKLGIWGAEVTIWGVKVAILVGVVGYFCENWRNVQPLNMRLGCAEGVFCGKSAICSTVERFVDF